MKKIIVLLLVLCMLFAFAGCGAASGGGKEDPVSNSVPVVDDFEDDEEEGKKEFPTLAGEDEYVVVRKIGTDFAIKDITEISKYRVGLVRGTDSELIGVYYCDEADVAIHGTDHDAFSDLSGGGVDIAICRKTAAETSLDRFEIILDPIKMIELK